MKKLTLLFLCLLLGGCATYRYGKGQKPYEKGYVVTRQNIAIPEYTLGKDNAVPGDLKLAKERFKRRKGRVEKYYKKMGLIENRFKQYIVNNMVNMVKFIGGVFTLPYRAYEDYRYEHNKKYHEKVVRQSDREDAAEKAKNKTLRQELSAYIQEDLAKEPPTPEALAPEPEKKPEVVAQQQPEPVKEAPVEPAQELPEKEVKIAASAEVPPAAKEPEEAPEPVPVQVAPSQSPTPKQKASFMESILKQLSKSKSGQINQPKAIIVAKPRKGISPLKVKFYGADSYSKGAKIISYEWDFGDGDKSTGRNPVNIFWCKSFGTTQFQVTLTVKDANGNTDTANTVVEAKTRPAR